MQKSLLSAVCFGALLAVSAASTGAQAQTPMAASVTPTLAPAIAPAKGDAKLTVTTVAFASGATIPEVYTQYGQSASPPLTWTAGPAGTQSYVVLTEDSGVSRTDPVFHWVVYDIPASMTSLPQAIAVSPKPSTPAGITQGLNIAKKNGFLGPKPPAGQVHPYHFEVFALDTTLGLDPATSGRPEVVNAMKGHVLAEGEVVGMVTGK